MGFKRPRVRISALGPRLSKVYFAQAFFYFRVIKIRLLPPYGKFPPNITRFTVLKYTKCGAFFSPHNGKDTENRLTTAAFGVFFISFGKFSLCCAAYRKLNPQPFSANLKPIDRLIIFFGALPRKNSQKAARTRHKTQRQAEA